MTQKMNITNLNDVKNEDDTKNEDEPKNKIASKLKINKKNADMKFCASTMSTLEQEF